jgi:regulator of CtrA degradation
MDPLDSVRTLERRLIDSLYVEAIVLADEARAYFDHVADGQRDALDSNGRVDFACESLKVTTRIMHVVAWLLTQRAVFAGEIGLAERLDERYRLGPAAPTERGLRDAFPPEMEGLILTSEDLYDRIARLEAQMVARSERGEKAISCPVRDLLNHLETRL